MTTQTHPRPNNLDQALSDAWTLTNLAQHLANDEEASVEDLAVLAASTQKYIEQAQGLLPQGPKLKEVAHG